MNQTDERDVDRHVYAYFRKILEAKYGNSLSKDELEQMLDQVYARFTKYLVEEFKRATNIKKQQIDEFRRIYNNDPDQESVDYLESLAQNGTNTDLNTLLVEILARFMRSYTI